MTALAASLYLAWWVIRISAVGAEVDENPFLAAKVDPGHPRVRIELAMAEFYLRQGRVSDQTEALAIDAVARAPLADEPFLLAGVSALARGDEIKGEKLLAEAKRRNPRLRLARLLLLDRYLRAHRLDEAATEMAVLNGLVGGADIVLIPALARMTQDRATATEMIPILQRQPDLREGVLNQLATNGADPDLILRIAQGGSREAGQAWQGSLVAGLVAKGAFDRALRIWRMLAGVGGSGGAKGLYDQQFLGRAGPPPFNWALATGAAGVAERTRGGGLQVDYYGREEGDLASQLLILPAGAYRLRFRAEGDAKGESSRLLWRVSCASKRDSLFQLPIIGVSTSPKIFSGTVAIPVGCGAEWLTLHGTLGDVVSEQNVKITDLSLVPEAVK